MPIYLPLENWKSTEFNLKVLKALSKPSELTVAFITTMKVNRNSTVSRLTFRYFHSKNMPDKKTKEG